MNIKQGKVLLLAGFAAVSLTLAGCDDAKNGSRGGDQQEETPGGNGQPDVDRPTTCEALVAEGLFTSTQECASFFASNANSEDETVCEALVREGKFEDKAACDAFFAPDDTQPTVCEALVADGTFTTDEECELFFNPEPEEPRDVAVCKQLVGAQYDPLQDADKDCRQNDSDNCPFTANFDQEQRFNERFGDACINDVDGDGIPDDDDACPLVPGETCVNGDGNPDADGDGVANDTDNCPFNANPEQEESSELIPNSNPAKQRGIACEGDFDGDGVADDTDNCSTSFNPSQRTEDACLVPPPEEPEPETSPLFPLTNPVGEALDPVTDAASPLLDPLTDVTQALAGDDPLLGGIIDGVDELLNDGEGGTTGGLGETTFPTLDEFMTSPETAFSDAAEAFQEDPAAALGGVVTLLGDAVSTVTDALLDGLSQGTDMLPIDGELVDTLGTALTDGAEMFAAAVPDDIPVISPLVDTLTGAVANLGGTLNELENPDASTADDLDATLTDALQGVNDTLTAPDVGLLNVMADAAGQGEQVTEINEQINTGIEDGLDSLAVVTEPLVGDGGDALDSGVVPTLADALAPVTCSLNLFGNCI